MATKIEIKDDPLTVQLPPTLDTNDVYKLFWSPHTEKWEVFPVAAQTYDEFIPI